MENVMLNIEMKEGLRSDFKIWCIQNKTTMRDEIVKFIEEKTKE